jgi:hypothetical protein
MDDQGKLICVGTRIGTCVRLVEGTPEMSGWRRTTRKSMRRSREISGYFDLVTDRGQKLQ